MAELGVRFDHVAGTSIGALNGAFWCQGDGSVAHAQRMCELWREMPEAGLVRINLTSLAGPLPVALVNQTPMILSALQLLAPSNETISVLDPGPVMALMDRVIDYEHVCRSRPGLTVAVLRETDPVVDILTAPWRSAEYLTAAELGPRELRSALLASAAIPLAFPSRRVHGVRYADAGLVDNLPAGTLRDMGYRRITTVAMSAEDHQDQADFPGCNLHQICSSQGIDANLLSVFDFSSAQIEAQIEQGYQETDDFFGAGSSSSDWEVLLQTIGELVGGGSGLLPLMKLLR